MVEEILKMYFEEHMKQKDIAEFFKVLKDYKNSENSLKKYNVIIG